MTFFKNKILKVGKRLAEDGSEAGPILREFHSGLSKIKTEDSHIKFLVFFLFSFIDDLYFNLSGDFPSNEKTDDIRNTIFKNIGGLLVKLSNTLGQNKFENCYYIYIDMVLCYLDGLNQIATATNG